MEKSDRCGYRLGEVGWWVLNGEPYTNLNRIWTERGLAQLQRTVILRLL